MKSFSYMPAVQTPEAPRDTRHSRLPGFCLPLGIIGSATPTDFDFGANTPFTFVPACIEDGRLTDSQGRTVDFKNTVIIMTSNLGTAELRKKAIGFAEKDDELSYNKMREKVMDSLKKQFRPEFLNRIDEVIVFHELTMDEVKTIVELLIGRVRTQLESQALDHALSDAAKTRLAEKRYDPQLGARPLRRAIQQMLEDPLSERVLQKEFPAGATILVDVDEEDEDSLSFVSVETPAQPPVELAESE